MATGLLYSGNALVDRAGSDAADPIAATVLRGAAEAVAWFAIVLVVASGVAILLSVLFAVMQWRARETVPSSAERGIAAVRALLGEIDEAQKNLPRLKAEVAEAEAFLELSDEQIAAISKRLSPFTWVGIGVGVLSLIGTIIGLVIAMPS